MRKRYSNLYIAAFPLCTVLILLFFICSSNDSATAVYTDRAMVSPCGSAAGICLYTDGLLVTGSSSVTDTNGRQASPAADAGIKKGDIILSAGGQKFQSTEELSAYITGHSDAVTLEVMRQAQTFSTQITPSMTETGPKIGLWVRDSTAGIGTITYYNPSDHSLGVLGHGITDVDTGTTMTVRSGKLLPCTLTPPTKGEKGVPGELNGVFASDRIGTLQANTESGVYCSEEDLSSLQLSPLTPVAHASEVYEGNAYILADVDGDGIQKYDIEIKKCDPGKKNGKNLVIKVTDESLIEKTGGIVQGMSGSPIIQNGMLAGAVTHVFINDPKKGYGILAETMILEHQAAALQ